MTTDTTDRVDLPGAPSIPGLRFRRYRGAEDLPGMLDALHAANEADGNDDRETLEEMTHAYAHLSNSDPARDVLIFEVDSSTIGYSRRYWSELTEGGRSYESFCFLRPEWRRRGIASAVLPYNEAGLREIAAGHPGIEPKWLSSGALDTATGNLALLQKADYQAVRYGYEMNRSTLDDIPSAPMPPGIEVRPVERGHYRQIWEANTEAFLDEWGEHDDSDAAFERYMGSPSADPTLWRVAWDGGEVAGMVIASIDIEGNRQLGRARGWLDSVGVRRPWRRRGLARALMAQSLLALRERGMTSAGLGVDTENPSGALLLYESLGFEPVKRFTSFRKPL